MPSSRNPKLPPDQYGRKYLANAKELLAKKAQKLDGLYQDEKYVKMVGHTAFAGVQNAELVVTSLKPATIIINWAQARAAA